MSIVGYARVSTIGQSLNVQEGIAKAKMKGVRLGAKAKLTNEQIIEMCKKREDGMLIKELMSYYSLSKASIYRLLKD